MSKCCDTILDLKLRDCCLSCPDPSETGLACLACGCFPLLMMCQKDGSHSQSNNMGVGALWFLSSCCIIGCPIIIYLLLLVNSFWISALASQTGVCNLVLLKGKMVCGYWPMVLEIVIWETIFCSPLIICSVVAIILTPIVNIAGCFAWLIMSGSFMPPLG